MEASMEVSAHRGVAVHPAGTVGPVLAAPAPAAPRHAGAHGPDHRRHRRRARRLAGPGPRGHPGRVGHRRRGRGGVEHDGHAAEPGQHEHPGRHRHEHQRGVPGRRHQQPGGQGGLRRGQGVQRADPGDPPLREPDQQEPAASTAARSTRSSCSSTRPTTPTCSPSAGSGPRATRRPSPSSTASAPGSRTTSSASPSRARRRCSAPGPPRPTGRTSARPTCGGPARTWHRCWTAVVQWGVSSGRLGHGKKVGVVVSDQARRPGRAQRLPPARPEEGGHHADGADGGRQRRPPRPPPTRTRSWRSRSSRPPACSR